MEPAHPLDWNTVEAQLANLIAEASLDQRTIHNTRDLLSRCREQCAPPSDVGKGYWEPVSLSWPKWEVEVFPDRFELYHFKEKTTDISEYPREAGEPIPQALIEQLPRLRRQVDE